MVNNSNIVNAMSVSAVILEKSFFPVAHSASSLQMKFLGMPLKN